LTHLHDAAFHASIFHIGLISASQQARLKGFAPWTVMASQYPQKRILVVDDNRDAADLTAQLLELHGHTTFVAYGGREGIQAAIHFVPEVVLLDLGMPEVDGFAVAVTLRALSEIRQPVLIAYTAWNSAEIRRRTQAEGFDVHMVKPAKFEDILVAVATTQRLTSRGHER
jgi:CheY-like chemotaxis protein